MTEPQKKVLLVGISGKIGSGKTTLADELASQVQKTTICNFADALKIEVADQYGIELARFYKQEEKNKPVSDSDPTTLGELLQRHGEERRAENADYWVERTGAYIDALGTDAFELVVVGDVRRTNEAAFITKRGGLLVRLNGDPGGVRAASTRDPNHPSEVELDNYGGFDLVFNTNNTGARGIAAAIIGWAAPE